MTQRSVVVSINSDYATEATHLNQEAAKSICYGGLTPDEALKMVTLNPAIQLGIDKRVSSIDVGKDADLVIYNHDPLSAYAVVQKTLIDGRVYFDREKDIAGRAALEKEKKDLLAEGEEDREKAKKPEEKKTGRETRTAKESGERHGGALGDVQMKMRRAVWCLASDVDCWAGGESFAQTHCDNRLRDHARKNLHAGGRAD